MINRDGMKEEEERENEILIENNLPSSCLHSHGHTSHGCTNQDLNNMMTKQTLFLLHPECQIGPYTQEAATGLAQNKPKFYH